MLYYRNTLTAHNHKQSFFGNSQGWKNPVILVQKNVPSINAIERLLELKQRKALCSSNLIRVPNTKREQSTPCMSASIWTSKSRTQCVWVICRIFVSKWWYIYERTFWTSAVTSFGGFSAWRLATKAFLE